MHRTAPGCRFRDGDEGRPGRQDFERNGRHRYPENQRRSEAVMLTCVNIGGTVMVNPLQRPPECKC